MRHTVLAAVVLLAGCTGFGPRAGAGDGCGAAQVARVDGEAPNLAGRAASDVVADGNRSVRWDLEVTDACQMQPATASIEVRRAIPAAGCARVDLRASVSTGLAELDIALGDPDATAGALTFDPRRTDLAPGPASFIVSLSATMTSNGFEGDDHRCLDAAVAGFTLQASHRAYQA